MVKAIVCTDLLLDLVLGNGWHTPEEENLYEKLENTQTLKKLIEADIVSVYLHPGLRNFVKIPIEEHFSSKERVRQEMKQLDKYITLESNISLEQSFEEFDDLELPRDSLSDEGLILVSAKMTRADALICTEETEFLLKKIIKLNPKYFRYFETSIYNLRNFLEHLNQDVRFISQFGNLRNSIFAKTPMGRIVELPPNATPIDFAHALHTKFTTCCRGAIVNGKQVSLNYVLKGGETVEILRGKPNEIFDYVKLDADLYPEIQQHLRAYCRKKSTIKCLKKAFEKNHRRKGWQIISKTFNKHQRKILEDPSVYYENNYLRGIKSRRELTFNLGLGKFNIEEVKKLIDNTEHVEHNFFYSPHNKDLLKTKKYSISTCCNPSLINDIVGIISSGKRPIRIHTKDCGQIKHIHSDNLIDLQWSCKLIGVNLQLNLQNKPDALSELLTFLNKSYCWKQNIHSVQPIKENHSSQVLTKMVLNQKHDLSQLLVNIRGLKKLNSVRVRDIVPLKKEMINNFFYDA